MSQATDPDGGVFRAGSADVTTIQEVVDELEAIIDRSERDSSRMGYFCALYHTVTRSVQRGIEAGYFDDGERMERFDVFFARRYLDALAAHRSGGDVPRTWQVAFDATQRWSPVVLQHVLLGINAHINLDLGIATAQTAPGDELPKLRRDYDRINEILVSIFEDIQRQLYEISPWMGLLDRLGGRYDDVIARFSIEKARAEAWEFARQLAPLDPANWGGPIKSRDMDAAALARKVARPGWLRLALLPIRLRESDDVSRVVQVLSQAEPMDFATLEARVEALTPPRWASGDVAVRRG